MIDRIILKLRIIIDIERKMWLDVKTMWAIEKEKRVKKLEKNL